MGVTKFAPGLGSSRLNRKLCRFSSARHRFEGASDPSDLAEQNTERGSKGLVSTGKFEAKAFQNVGNQLLSTWKLFVAFLYEAKWQLNEFLLRLLFAQPRICHSIAG